MIPLSLIFQALFALSFDLVLTLTGYSDYRVTSHNPVSLCSEPGPPTSTTGFLITKKHTGLSHLHPANISRMSQTAMQIFKIPQTMLG